MRRILLATYEYPPDLGGVARYLGGLFGAMPEGSVRVLKLRLPRLPLAWTLSAPRFLRAAREADVIVVSHLLPLGTLAMLSRKPYVVIVHGLDLRSAGASARKKALAGRVLRRASLVVANSRATASDLAAFGVEPASALVLTPGVETTEAAPSVTRRGILAVARFVPRKGLDRLVRLMPRLRERHPEATLTLAGAGPEEGSLRELARAAGDAVRFEIAPDDAALDRLYRAAAVFALPVRETPDDVEGFGIVYLEAAMRGVPCVGTRTGGVPEAVADGDTGILIPPGDDEALFRALDRLLSEPETAAKMGAKGRERAAREFAWPERAARLRERLP